MSILNEFKVCLYENRIVELIPTTGMDNGPSTGETTIDDSYVKSYEEAVRDCKEHATVDDAIDSVYKGLRKLDLTPFATPEDAWSGGFKNDIDVGQGGLAKLGLRKGSETVTNAILKIDLYKNSSGEYEIASEIVTR